MRKTAQALSAVYVPLADVCIRNQGWFALQVATPWQCAVAIAQAYPFHPDAVAFVNALAEDEGEPSVAALQEKTSSHADHDGKQHMLCAMCFWIACSATYLEFCSALLLSALLLCLSHNSLHEVGPCPALPCPGRFCPALVNSALPCLTPPCLASCPLL